MDYIYICDIVISLSFKFMLGTHGLNNEFSRHKMRKGTYCVGMNVRM